MSREFFVLTDVCFLGQHLKVPLEEVIELQEQEQTAKIVYNIHIVL